MDRETSIRLIRGADIHIRYDHQVRQYTATVTDGYDSRFVTADDPVTAIGLAVIMQSGLTENKLKKVLKVQPEEGQGTTV